MSVLKKAYSASAYVDVEALLDLQMQLEDLGVDEVIIEDISKDFEMAQKLGTYPAKDFIRDVATLYTMKDRQILGRFRSYLHDPVVA